LIAAAQREIPGNQQVKKIRDICAYPQQQLPITKKPWLSYVHLARTVKEQLGHSSIQMTVDIFGHLIPSSNRDAVNRLDETQPSATYPQPLQKQKA